MRETHAFLGKDRDCGCMLAACPDEPKFAEDVKGMIEGGLAVDRVTWEEARKHRWGHVCGKAVAQQPVTSDA